MKSFINYLWKNGLVPREKLTSASGEQVEVIATGQESTTDTFANTRLSIEGKEVCGTLKLHGAEGTIATEKGEEHTFYINARPTQETLKEFQEVAAGRHTPPCEGVAAALSNIKLHDFLTRLLVERIEEKAARITQIYEACDKRWDDTLFKLLARSFGFGIQGRAFEEWALTLNLQALGKHRDSLEQIEAIMFGQAGLLNQESIPSYYQNDALNSEYYQLLVREYKFLKSKFNLQEMQHSSWGGGNASPHVRIARLAKLFHSERLGTTAIASHNTLQELRNTLQVQPGPYWQHHTQFGSTTTSGLGDLNNKQLDVLIINTVVPMLYSYGKHRHDSNLCNKAEDFLYEISAESNSIVRRWTQQGLCINSAADSQALIQLNNAYCKMHRCTECRFAHIYFSNKLREA